jgi:hypothetical protein
MSGGAQAFDQSDNIRDRLYTELLHDTAALYLNCFFRGTELTSYLLVEHSLCYSYAHLSLSLCQGIEDGAVPAKLIATKADLLRSDESCLDGGEQFALFEGLGEKIDGARLHGLNRVRDMGVAADENKGQAFMSWCQSLLQIEAAHLRHLEVEDNTGGTGIKLLAEKLSRRRVGSNLVIMGPKKSSYRAADA